MGNQNSIVSKGKTRDFTFLGEHDQTLSLG